jgi:dihydroflavonol-4-reductase
MDAGHHRWTGTRVALTGASGFVGHHLAALLVRAGADVVALLRPTSDRSRLQALGVRCENAPLEDPNAIAGAARGSDVLIHVAGAVDFGDDWRRLDQINVDGTRHVIKAARRIGVRRLVHVSSIVAVGATKRPMELDESATWNLGPFRVPYVTTKRRAEILVLAEPDLDAVVVNPGCVVGPDDFTESEFGRLCKRFWRGRLPIHFGGGNNFVDVRDVAAGISLAAHRGRSGQRYILSGQNRTFSEFFADLNHAGKVTRHWLRLPSAMARFAARCASLRRDKSRSALTPAQARLMGLYFFFTHAKAALELGYSPRPLAETLADAHAFWIERRAA